MEGKAIRRVVYNSRDSLVNSFASMMSWEQTGREDATQEMLTMVYLGGDALDKGLTRTRLLQLQPDRHDAIARPVLSNNCGGWLTPELAPNSVDRPARIGPDMPSNTGNRNAHETSLP